MVSTDPNEHSIDLYFGEFDDERIFASFCEGEIWFDNIMDSSRFGEIGQIATARFGIHEVINLGLGKYCLARLDNISSADRGYRQLCWCERGDPMCPAHPKEGEDTIENPF